ncbi:MAG: hypothetical protein R3D03_08260 [Geminicoccaceae bacterium]
MGDIVEHGGGGIMRLSVDIAAAAPIERVDILDGKTARPQALQCGRSGAAYPGHLGRSEYRGCARQVIWDGDARIEGNGIRDARAINFFNRDRH